jgi:dienelactone hydrolase
MPTTPATFDLAPSIVHHRLMKANKPALSYAGQTGDAFKAWQRKLRRRVAELTGYVRMPRPDKPPKVWSIWKHDHALGSIEKLMIRTEPGSDAPAYLCLPRDAKPPYLPWVCVQGHAPGAAWSIGRDPKDDTQPQTIEGDRDYGLQCMARGLAALCIEQRAFGQKLETRINREGQSNCHDATMHALMLGRTLLAERVYDIARGIDYLKARGDMRMNKLGVMGNSGGGTATMFAAALLPGKVRFAMPSCYFCSFEASIMSLYHCMCNYVPNLLLEAEHADIMGLFAPRPVVIVAGAVDPIFPIKATRAELTRLKKIYAAAGAPDNCRLVVGAEGHRFYADIGWKAVLRYVGRD